MEQPSPPCEECIIPGLWRHLNTKPTFSNNRITAIKSLNSCTAPFPSASGVLRCYRNRLIIIIIIIHKRGYSLQASWESSMETHNHTGYTRAQGSPAWKHTFTQEDIQALWGGPALTQ